MMGCAQNGDKTRSTITSYSTRQQHVIGLILTLLVLLMGCCMAANIHHGATTTTTLDRIDTLMHRHHDASALRSEQHSNEEAAAHHSSVAVPNEYIVVFREYKWASEHGNYLSEVVNATEGFTVVERDNAATRMFPSDFAIVKFENTELLNRLMTLGHPLVKYVVPQRKYTVRYDNKPEGAGAGAGAGSSEDICTLRRNLLSATPGEAIRLDSEEAEWIHPVVEGRLGTKWTTDDVTNRNRRALLGNVDIVEALGAQELWRKGATGLGIRVAVFDTGLQEKHPFFRNVSERINYTDEDSADDNQGHGSFVAGVIASERECMGLAPEAELMIFKVFTSQQVSYTSWFLDAFNYALQAGVNILNLSIGGPDYMDMPFVEKVWEMTSNNVIVVSAIGNDGPLFGTLNNPADQPDVIGVGGLDNNERVASFSSRGMTAWELSTGYGRVKPDIVTYATRVRGAAPGRKCQALIGTSVASPVVTGAITLLASALPSDVRWNILNPASMKQILIETAHRLRPEDPNEKEASIFEQGMGKLDLIGAYNHLLRHYAENTKGNHNKASLLPPQLDFTDCPYMAPFCDQPLYYSAMPAVFNVTVLNGMGVTGKFQGEPKWAQLSVTPSENNRASVVDGQELIDIKVTYSSVLWPWTGYLAVHMEVTEAAKDFDGIVEGYIEATIISPPRAGSAEERTSTIKLPIKVRIIPTPPREKRILWDQFHNLQYPPAYVPRDNLSGPKEDILDWNGDHIHTNFRDLFYFLRSKGYFVEVLNGDYTTFDANNYGTLMIVDTEDEFHPRERAKLRHDVEELGLSVAVFAEWYNVDVMKQIKFFDDNTQSTWIPITGGANIPALNDLLREFGIALSDKIFTGEHTFNGEKVHFASGSSIARFPRGGYLASFSLKDQTALFLGSNNSKRGQTNANNPIDVPVLGFLNVNSNANSDESPDLAINLESHPKNGGRIAVFGDANCLDSAHNSRFCFNLLDQMLGFTSQGILPFKDAQIIKSPQAAKQQAGQSSGKTLIHYLANKPFSDKRPLPRRMPGSGLEKFSRVRYDNEADEAQNNPYRNLDRYEKLTITESEHLYFNYNNNHRNNNNNNGGGGESTGNGDNYNASPNRTPGDTDNGDDYYYEIDYFDYEEENEASWKRVSRPHGQFLLPVLAGAVFLLIFILMSIRSKPAISPARTQQV